MPEDLSVGGVRDRGTIVALNGYWQDRRITYDGSGNILYYAVTHYHNDPESSDRWEIWKYTHGANGVERIEGPLQGSVTNQATLGWGV